ncbi:MAG: hypothetical protein MUF38_04850 [Anaerolineae bacterium]|nr:hypothetical protein [Anaerolineae bacterium]
MTQTATIWCVSAPLYSHTDWGGFLRTAHALTQRGHRVSWVSGTAIAGAVSGLPFLPLDETGWLWPPPPLPDISTIKPQDAIMVRYRRALDTWLDEGKVADGVRGLLALAEQHGAPDLILTDPFLSASAIAAEVLGVPMVVCGWPALRELDETLLYPVQKVLADDSRQRVDRLCQMFGVVGENFSTGPTPSILSPHLHLSYFCDTLRHMVSSRRSQPARPKRVRRRGAGQRARTRLAGSDSGVRPTGSHHTGNDLYR